MKLLLPVVLRYIVTFTIDILTLNGSHVFFLHGSAPRYLGPLVPVADQPGRRTLRSGGVSRLLVPPTRQIQQLATGLLRLLDLCVWNTLPEEITTSQSLPTFCQRLKTYHTRTADIIIETSLLQGGHKPGILRDFSEHGKLREFSVNSVQPQEKL